MRSLGTRLGEASWSQLSLLAVQVGPLMLQATIAVVEDWEQG